MPWYYTTVEELKTWNIAVEAADAKEAKLKSLQQAVYQKPDYTDGPAVTLIEEVKKHVE